MDNLFFLDRMNFSIITENLPQVISTVFIVIAVAVIRIVIRKLVATYANVHSHSDLRVNQVHRLTRVFVNIAALIILIVIWGVDTKNLFVTLSSVFAVIGVALFAQWSVLSNVTSGVILFFSPAYRIGNYIRILDKDLPTEAKIEDIFAFYTHLRTREGELQIFPNNLLLQKAIQILDDQVETENLV